jgi:hypothetical protein
VSLQLGLARLVVLRRHAPVFTLDPAKQLAVEEAPCFFLVGCKSLPFLARELV